MSKNTEQVVDLIDWLGVDLRIIDKKRKLKTLQNI